MIASKKSSKTKPFLAVLTMIFASLAMQLMGAQGAVLSERRNLAKTTYKVGVLENQGPGSSQPYNVSFSDYLTAAAGNNFDPPIRFEMVPLRFDAVLTSAAGQLVDFIYANPTHFTCVEAEYGAQSLVSVISRRVIGEAVYNLSEFAGVITTRADNDEIKGIQDLKDKVIAAVAISGLGAGQMQFREMQNAGLSYVNDPKQLVLTGNQAQIVNGVIDGTFEVGFIRTDQVERTKDQYGNLVDPSLLKILEPRVNTIDGEPFPFVSSTPLYSEWNLAALSHVPREVSSQVVQAMLSLTERAEVGQALQDCLATGTNNSLQCQEASTSILVAKNECSTSEYLEVAAIASRALASGRFAGFRPTLSYSSVRSMLQENSFLSKNDTSKIWQCAGSQDLYDAIACPPGHYKKTHEEVDRGCAEAGLSCDPDHTCVCSPCRKAFEVDVSPIEVAGAVAGCARMELCGTVQQTKPLTFRAIDNRRREDAVMTATIHGRTQERVTLEQSPEDPHAYDLTVSANYVGIQLVELFIDGEQIPESPIRFQVESRNCDEDFHSNGLRTADANGECICRDNTVTIGDTCVPLKVLLPCIFVPLAIICALGVWWFVEKKKRDADSLWTIKADELIFDEPAKIVGQGTFGVVLMAEFRGTQVAVKRVLPPRKSGAGGSNHRSGSRSAKISPSPSPSMESEGKAGVPEQHPSASSGSVPLIDVESPAAAGMTSITRFPRLSNGTATQSFSFASVDLDVLTNKNNSKQQNSKSGSSKGKRTPLSNFRSKSIDRIKAKANFIQEMRMLSKLRHPCIVTIMGAVIETEDPMLCMEFMSHGSLHDVLHNETMVIDGEFMLQVLQDIAQGVRFLHSSDPPVIHRDLKAANVLISSDFRAKISDFGLSHRDGKRGAAGSPFWMAPEVLRGETSNTTMSDMYSLGIVLYELYSRKDPYEGEDTDRVLQLVCQKSGINKRPPVPRTCPPKITILMKALLRADPTKRPTASELDMRVRNMDISQVSPGEILLSSRPNIKREQPDTKRTDVLYQVFPRKIADILANGGKPEPETHDMVTIFFSDIVGFTRIASMLSPLKVSKLLDRLYLAFDELVGKHGLFKIETVGDAYMCASNLEEDQRSDHVKRVAEFALDAVEAASQILIDEERPEFGYTTIRAGFHSGTVVSNVVGHLAPRFGIFGDTVNTASRMESTSSAGRVQCSDLSAQLLSLQAPEIEMESCGEHNVKGKGVMTTFFVKQRHQALY